MINSIASHYYSVDGDRMHVRQAGSRGSPIVFLHGVPVSSMTWSYVMDHMKDRHRCYAPDMIGMGLSDKPDIPYRIFDHLFYTQTLLDQLDLDDITLVMHGWGSIIGFDYAMRNSHRIKSMVFYEAHPKPVQDWGMLSLPVQQCLHMLKTHELDYDAVIKDNRFMSMLFPMAMMKSLPQEHYDHYQDVFSSPSSRKLLWQYCQDLPIPGHADDVVALVQHYSHWLEQTAIPKLMIYSTPGFITTMDTVSWCHEHLPYLDLFEVGQTMHFAQELRPRTFSDALLAWVSQLHVQSVR